MGNVLEYVSSYFTKWSATTAQYDSTNHIQICTSTLSSTWLVTMVTEVAQEILARTKLPSTVLPLARHVLGKKQEQHNDKWEEQPTYFKAQT